MNFYVLSTEEAEQFCTASGARIVCHFDFYDKDDDRNIRKTAGKYGEYTVRFSLKNPSSFQEIGKLYEFHIGDSMILCETDAQKVWASLLVDAVRVDATAAQKIFWVGWGVKR